jgi:hypothetical protein
MKIKYVKASSVDEYFAMPKSEREWYGLYRKPLALPLEWFDENEKGWVHFYKEIKKEYPIQWFIREWCFSFENPIYAVLKRIQFFIDDKKYALKNFISPPYPMWRKTLPRHQYKDVTTIVVESNFNLILDFYQGEKKNGNVDWNAQENTKKFFEELTSVVKWIEEDRIKWEKELNDELSNASKNRKEKDYEKKYGQYDKLQKVMKDKETEILKWFIDNREFFWS